uniref:Uncharacterized protein n=1 Tax=Arundo donax TaxID=35708 RepID=A0A0A9A632_ARUDO
MHDISVVVLHTGVQASKPSHAHFVYSAAIACSTN